MTIDVLLAGLVDDAGLFPPEKLDMASALARHAADRRAGHPMHTHRFLCPASRVYEALPLLAGDEVLDLAIVLDGDALLLGSAVRAADDPRVTVVAVEAPLGDQEVAQRVAELAALLPTGARVWLECGWREGVAGRLAELAAALAAQELDGGAKLRCGGVRQELFPAVDQLASAIQACAALGMPWKATAGLHRFTRYTDEATGLRHHGFGNLLLAAADPARARKALVLTDERALVQGLSGARPDSARNAFRSYGSCSTSEPLEEAARLSR